GRLRKVADGRYEASGLAPGAYELIGRAPHLTIAIESTMLDEHGGEVKLTFAPAREITVQVADGATSAPVEWATVTVLGASPQAPVHRRRTGKDGTATISNVPTTSDGESMKIRIDHPAYATVTADVTADTGPLLVRLRPGGTVVGHVLDGGAVPDRVYMI